MTADSRAALWQTLVEALERQLSSRGLTRDDLDPSATMDEVGISSMDAMNLMITLEESLGRPLGYQGLLSEEGDFLGELTLAELLEMLDSQVRTETAGAPPDLAV